MTAGPRASERGRAGALASFGSSSRAGVVVAGFLVAGFAALSTLAACRQTVVLDPGALAAGAPAASGGAGGGLGGGGSGVGGGGGHAEGRLDAGSRDDAIADRPVAFCSGGHIQQLAYTLRSPDVIVAVDRSAGMQSWFGEGTRLQVI
jgi:hypothetical protein